MNYIDKLIVICQRAKSAKPISDFVLADAQQLNGIDKAIYIIEEIDGESNKTFNLFSTYKKSKQRACPKLNSPSPVMYVGSSTTSIKRRLDQHMGHGPKDTYALHLKHWFPGQYKITIKVYDEPLEVLQIIEDALSHELKPAFGKRGSNNK